MQQNLAPPSACVEPGWTHEIGISPSAEGRKQSQIAVAQMTDFSGTRVQINFLLIPWIQTLAGMA